MAASHPNDNRPGGVCDCGDFRWVFVMVAGSPDAVSSRCEGMGSGREKMLGCVSEGLDNTIFLTEIVNAQYAILNGNAA